VSTCRRVVCPQRPRPNNRIVGGGGCLTSRHSVGTRVPPVAQRSLVLWSSSIRRSVMCPSVIARYVRRWCWCRRSRTRVIQTFRVRRLALFIRRRALYFFFVTVFPLFSAPPLPAPHCSKSVVSASPAHVRRVYTVVKQQPNRPSSTTHVRFCHAHLIRVHSRLAAAVLHSRHEPVHRAVTQGRSAGPHAEMLRSVLLRFGFLQR